MSSSHLSSSSPWASRVHGRLASITRLAATAGVTAVACNLQPQLICSLDVEAPPEGFVAESTVMQGAGFSVMGEKKSTAKKNVNSVVKAVKEQLVVQHPGEQIETTVKVKSEVLDSATRMRVHDLIDHRIRTEDAFFSPLQREIASEVWRTILSCQTQEGKRQYLPPRFEVLNTDVVRVIQKHAELNRLDQPQTGDLHYHLFTYDSGHSEIWATPEKHIQNMNDAIRDRLIRRVAVFAPKGFKPVICTYPLLDIRVKKSKIPEIGSKLPNKTPFTDGYRTFRLQDELGRSLLVTENSGRYRPYGKGPYRYPKKNQYLIQNDPASLNTYIDIASRKDGDVDQRVEGVLEFICKDNAVLMRGDAFFALRNGDILMFPMSFDEYKKTVSNEVAGSDLLLSSPSPTNYSHAEETSTSSLSSSRNTELPINCDKCVQTDNLIVDTKVTVIASGSADFRIETRLATEKVLRS